MLTRVNRVIKFIDMAKIVYQGGLRAEKSNYPGDCALKKRARERDIDTALNVVGDDFRSKTYLLLAGWEGRDIQELLDWGIPAKNIWACERCGPDFKAVTKRFAKTGVNFLGCELKDIPEEYGPWDVMILDMCGPLSDANDDTIKSLLACRLTKGGVIQISVQAGRDSGRHNRYLEQTYPQTYNLNRFPCKKNSNRPKSDYGIPRAIQYSFNQEWGFGSGRWPVPQQPVLVATRKYQRPRSNLVYIGLTYKLRGAFKGFRAWNVKMPEVVEIR